MKMNQTTVDMLEMTAAVHVQLDDETSRENKPVFPNNAVLSVLVDESQVATRKNLALLKGIMTDEMIEEACNRSDPLIFPFVNQQIREDDNGRKIISFGLSSMGYDVTLQPKFKLFTNLKSTVIDPLNMNDDVYHDIVGDDFILPPNAYFISVTDQYFNLSKDEMAIVIGKSTWARAGLMINATPIEPGFRGQVVIEGANLTNSPIKIYAHMGIAQFVFFKSEEPCRIGYGDRAGKYQGQTGITTARI